MELWYLHTWYTKKKISSKESILAAQEILNFERIVMSFASFDEFFPEACTWG